MRNLGNVLDRWGRYVATEQGSNWPAIAASNVTKADDRPVCGGKVVDSKDIVERLREECGGYDYFERNDTTVRDLTDEAATEIERLRAARFDVVQLQPDDDSPGLWIGFQTAADRDEAMKLFRDVQKAPTCPTCNKPTRNDGWCADCELVRL